MLIFVLSLAAYLIGSIPFGLLVARVFGKIDIRTVGSGNIGATNVGRVMGFKWFIVVFVLDALKGLLPTLAAKLMLASEPVTLESMHGPTIVGAATIIGHMFPCYLKFRGGKGVATGLGVVFVLAPLASAIAAGTFALTMLLWRTVSISSLIGAISFAVAELLLLKPHPFTRENCALGLFSLLVPGLIIYRHRSNIVRLIKGEEKAFTPKESAEPAKSPEPR